jgi:hypothetical protein
VETKSSLKIFQALSEALAQELRRPTFSKQVASEFTELVGKVFLFCEALDLNDGAETPGLEELVGARSDYDGPGIMPPR